MCGMAQNDWTKKELDAWNAILCKQCVLPLAPPKRGRNSPVASELLNVGFGKRIPWFVMPEGQQMEDHPTLQPSFPSYKCSPQEMKTYIYGHGPIMYIYIIIIIMIYIYNQDRCQLLIDQEVCTTQILSFTTRRCPFPTRWLIESSPIQQSSTTNIGR